MSKTPKFQKRFLHPRYWGFWSVLLVMRCLVLLPLRWQFYLGKKLGLLCYKLLHSRRHTTLVNLALCFSTKTTEEQETLAKQVFVNAGIGIFETMNAWWRPKQFKNKVSISGLEHLQNAQKNGNAILLLGAHYTILDLGGLICSNYFRVDNVYRPQNSDILEWLAFRGRKAIFNNQISFKDTRNIARSLRSGHILWYTPDQDFGLKHGVMAPFFGVQAATITAGRRLAKIGDTSVLAIHFYRQTDFSHGKQPHYHISISHEISNYPSQDETADATRINQLLESFIRKDISQYMWFHRRFKTQPNNKNYYQ